MTPHAAQDPAFPSMVMDMLSNVLSRAEHPGELSRYLTEELRELTGARLVVLLDCKLSEDTLTHRVLGLNPQRHQAILDTPEMTRLIDIVHRSAQSVIWLPQEPSEAGQILKQWGFSRSIGIPLEVAAMRVGALFIFGLPEDDTHLADEIELLRTLSITVALVLRNALIYEDQEQVIDERTRQLRAANTELQQSRAELARANRALRAVLACNEALVHAEDETALLHNICQIIVDIGGYSMAWVGQSEQDAAKSITPVARAGERDNYLSKIKFSWADDERGPTSRAVRSGKLVIVHDIRTDTTELASPGEVLRLGYAACIALPLTSATERIGALTIFANDPDAFNDEEVSLLSGLAEDMAFGLLTLRTRAARQQAETRLALNAIHAQTLASLSEALAQASPSVQAVLDTAAERIAQSLGDACVIRLLSEDRQTVNLAAFHHHNPGTMDLIGQTLAKINWRTSMPTIAHIVSDGQALFYPQINAQGLAALVEEAHQDLVEIFKISAIMLIPLYSHGKLTGMVTAFRDETQMPYTRDDLAFLQDMVDRTGMVYTNARLFEQVQGYSSNLEQRVQERTLQLEATNKELESFSYSVSHDLRSPLRAIDGFSSALIEDYAADLRPEARRLLDRVRANAQQMSRLVDGLLEFSRTGRKPLTRVPIHATEIVHQVIDDLQHERAGRQVEFVVADLPPFDADPILIKQVFINLISNALKFTRKRAMTRIEVGFLKDGAVPGQPLGARGCYYVRDNGIGFDMQYADKLFGVFQRQQKDEDYEGTGVGLAIVQRIIQRHGGRAWAEAEEDGGATFYFTVEGE